MHTPRDVSGSAYAADDLSIRCHANPLILVILFGVRVCDAVHPNGLHPHHYGNETCDQERRSASKAIATTRNYAFKTQTKP